IRDDKQARRPAKGAVVPFVLQDEQTIFVQVAHPTGIGSPPGAKIEALVALNYVGVCAGGLELGRAPPRGGRLVVKTDSRKRQGTAAHGTEAGPRTIGETAVRADMLVHHSSGRLGMTTKRRFSAWRSR